MTQQIPLDINLPDDRQLSNFIMGDNALLFNRCESLIADHTLYSDANSLTFISGDNGTGKSHLLVALCHEAAKAQLTHFYLALSDKSPYPAEILDGLESMDLICIDNLDCIEGDETWQRALFDLINRCREKGKAKLVVSALKGPKMLAFKLADLSSRLSWGTSFTIKPLLDQQMQEAIVLKGKTRGINISKQVARFLMIHTTRDMHSLVATLDLLDSKTLEEKRRLSVPFIKQTLDL